MASCFPFLLPPTQLLSWHRTKTMATLVLLGIAVLATDTADAVAEALESAACATTLATLAAVATAAAVWRRMADVRSREDAEWSAALQQSDAAPHASTDRDTDRDTDTATETVTVL